MAYSHCTGPGQVQGTGKKLMGYKKVLLRERKRHTARHAASTPYVVLSLLTPPPASWTWPTPPRLDLTPPAAGPDPPRQLDLTNPPGSWTWPTPPPRGRVATFESVQNSLTFPWHIAIFPWQFILFFQVKNKNYPQKQFKGPIFVLNIFATKELM